MKIPETLKVGGFNYLVKKGYEFSERTDLKGQTQHELLKIVIAEKTAGGKSYPKQQTEECFIHEIVHAVDYIYNNNSLKEKDVSAISLGLYQVLNDNGLLR